MNKIVLIVFLTFHLVRGNEGSLNEDNPVNATLIVLGQSGHGISTTVRKLLGRSKHPVVGYGFDVRKDKLLLKTPFVADKFKASSIGYRLPSFISCSTIEPLEEVVYSICNENFEEYVATRMHFLGLHKDTTKSFQGKVRPGLMFELKGNATTVFSVVREFRTLKCELRPEVIHVNEQFKNTINNLGSFNSRDRDSVKKWVEFFENYGTHIVSIGYGGGSIEGRLEARSSQNLFDKLKSIVQFGTFSTQEMPNYKFFGGSWDKQINLHSLEQHERKNVLASWKNSVKDDPIMFDFELSLIPISTYAKFANITLGEEVDKCVELFLAGRLAFLDPETTVGKGFNLLNGTVLWASPFLLGNCITQGIANLVPDSSWTVTVGLPERTVGYGYNSLTGGFLSSSPFQYIDKLRIVSGSLLELKVRKGTVLSGRFVKRVRDLYSMSSSGTLMSKLRMSCSVKRAWKQFFETYGTHYVNSGFVGQFELYNATESSKKVSLNCGDQVWKWGVQLETIGLLFHPHHYRLKSEIDEMHNLFARNNLEC